MPEVRTAFTWGHSSATAVADMREPLSPMTNRYSQSADADSTMAGDRAAIFHRATRVAITLNPTGTILWNSLTSPRTSDELIQELAGRFPSVSETQLRQDVGGFIDQLASHGLLQIS